MIIGPSPTISDLMHAVIIKSSQLCAKCRSCGCVESSHQIVKWVCNILKLEKIFHKFWALCIELEWQKLNKTLLGRSLKLSPVLQSQLGELNRRFSCFTDIFYDLSAFEVNQLMIKLSQLANLWATSFRFSVNLISFLTDNAQDCLSYLSLTDVTLPIDYLKF